MQLFAGGVPNRAGPGCCRRVRFHNLGNCCYGWSASIMRCERYFFYSRDQLMQVCADFEKCLGFDGKKLHDRSVLSRWHWQCCGCGPRLPHLYREVGIRCVGLVVDRTLHESGVVLFIIKTRRMWKDEPTGESYPPTRAPFEDRVDTMVYTESGNNIHALVRTIPNLLLLPGKQHHRRTDQHPAKSGFYIISSKACERFRISIVLLISNYISKLIC